MIRLKMCYLFKSCGGFQYRIEKDKVIIYIDIIVFSLTKTIVLQWIRKPEF